MSEHMSLIVELVYHLVISKSPACKHPFFIPDSPLVCSFPSLPNDVTLAVFAVGAQTLEGWDFLYSKYQSSLSSTEKNQIEFALCISQNKEKLQW